ncbi:hypothetical protein J2Z40_003522 [Cytobacillus eiseniae]|uniref:YxiJ-like protein n=1 Tax=Cytobacillus eiseniae TaxID=762947 RepID=A0ABS4RKR1_9BACI|nr:YxiJ family protein [Cytobacillus eiseniae]MBP2242940.1 hypothetical protein [Cytobacillus eiseniae]
MDLHEMKEQLVLMNEKLSQPFPYRDTDRIQEDYCVIFEKLSDEENGLTADFNTYCMNIAGTLSYVLREKSKDIPNGQVEMLHFSFFEYFKQYTFFEESISHYNDFYQEYMSFEETRKLLLAFLRNE